ncbi:hypothetical protein chiPu_0002914 [Chiloscyllium punctatum]|uniref:GRAM domain-containing protein n=1 Tax=Chiloscyllium punctatum TaxID=137246 RepID=A0A401S281_CHIPU|nr:hypothetical protein [Chiloscyllium punctatum]
MGRRGLVEPCGFGTGAEGDGGGIRSRIIQFRVLYLTVGSVALPLSSRPLIVVDKHALGASPAGDSAVRLSAAPAGNNNHHVKVKEKNSVLNMLKRFDKIRFRGQKRDEILDLVESPNASDNECGDEIPAKSARCSMRDSEELKDPAGPGASNMASGIQDFSRTESDRLNEIKGHLEIALLEKHFLQEELRKLREETNAETLKQELEKEKLKRIELEQKISDVIKTRGEDSSSQQSLKVQTSVNGTEKRGKTFYSKIQKWFFEKFSEYIEDFQFQKQENPVETEEPLSAKRLTENMRRLTILRLSLNYLIARGWRIQWSIVPEVSDPVEPSKEDLTVSEKFQLVLDVAQKAQNLFGKMADVLEKIKNLFMWVHPEITQKLYMGLWILFIASCFFPYRILGLFIVVSRSNVTANSMSVYSREDDGARSHSSKKSSFSEIFNLAENERPLPVCENGWRCCLINRDKKIPTDYIRNGFLYVTENYLCFESSKSGSSKKNKIIKLKEITDIQKYKVLSVLPGSGMGISVTTPYTQKPLVFGAMLHRDEAFEAINCQHTKITSSISSNET